MQIPILLIIYNRPKITKQQLVALSKIKPKELFVFCDGYKNNIDKKKVIATRKLIDNISWNCKIKTNFKEKNLGCKNGVETAIDWFFKNVSEGVILEDDCIPNKSFFKFSNELLNKYRDDKRISVITGFNIENKLEDYKFDYYFSIYGGVWGWASWADRWKEYRKSDLKKLMKDKYLIKSLKRKGVSKTFISYANKCLNGSLDTWDYIWTFYNISQNKLSVVPQMNFISNIGFGVDATHTKIISSLSNAKHEILNKEIQHPDYIFPNYIVDNKKRLNHNKVYQLYRVIKSFFNFLV